MLYVQIQHHLKSYVKFFPKNYMLYGSCETDGGIDPKRYTM